MKQMGLALFQYAQDNDEYAPLQGYAASDGNTLPQSQWSATMWALYPYVKSVGVYKCPDDSTQWASSYLVNNNLYGPLAIYNSPAQSVAFVEGMVYGQPVAWSPNRPGDVNNGLDGDYTVFCAAGRLQARHIGGTMTNILFADGHVKTSKPITNGTTDATGTAAALTAKAASLKPFFPLLIRPRHCLSVQSGPCVQSAALACRLTQRQPAFPLSDLGMQAANRRTHPSSSRRSAITRAGGYFPRPSF